MAYDATVFSVMIASPSDVVEERNIIRDTLHEWNDLNSRATNCVVLPVGWETHAAPDLATRAQEVINTTVLNHCDLLVGVFWTRLGTPTGEAESGTVEEIKRHISAGKPAMVYFSTSPVAPASLDAEQYNALTNFKQWCYDKGLVEEYNNIGNFSEKFRRQIQIKVRDSFLSSPYTRAVDEAALSSGQSAYGVQKEDSIVGRLREESKALISAAAKDPQGSILNVRFLGGQAIQTNGVNFTDSKDRRSIARWEAALEEVEAEGLIIARGTKREVFEVTRLRTHSQ